MYITVDNKHTDEICKIDHTENIHNTYDIVHIKQIIHINK